MSKDFRHGQNQRLKAGKSRRSNAERAPRESEYDEQFYKDALRHAVRTQDREAFEDYDEEPS